MVARSVQEVFRTLNRADVRYLVAGGLAVVAHGFLRATIDIDLVVALDRENALRGVRALAGLGYRPIVPVDLESFADAEQRRRWIAEKRATVFQLFSDRHPSTSVDLFLELPFDFEQAHSRAHWDQIAEGVRVPFVGLDDLIAMKEKAARPQDLIDAEKLRLLRRSRGGTG